MSLRRYVIFVLVLVSPGYGQKPNLEILGRRQDVYVAGFFPFGKGVEQSGTGRGVMPSVKLALDHVNEHTGVLRNYRLHMWWNDTECNAAVGVKSFFDMMSSGPHKLMLFGAACTHVTDPIAKASKHWHLTQLSYADTHPMFTKDSFPNFFRIVPSENAFNLPRLALLKHFNWTRVGTIYQNEPRYSLAHNRLVADLDDHGFQIVETQSFATEVKTALSKLKDKDVRIILGNFNETWAAKVFCEAYKLDMYGRSYQWLIMGAYSENWWEKISQCKQEELGKALDAAILTDLLPLSTTGDITISGITASEYQVEYDRRRGSEYSRFHGYTYDGIWAVALAIQHVATRARAMRKERGVADFRYRDPLWEALFLDALKNVSFEGVTGPVRFYDNERKASILLKQFQGLEKGEVKVGEYCSELSRLEFSTGLPFRWIGRIPPKDRTLHIIERSQVDITIYAVLASCAVMGILLATLFLGMNIHYRNQRYIKMSSPHLNNLIIIGCMLTYLSVIFLGLDSGLSSIAAFPYICTARAWLLMAGFSLAFGAMFSKTWRVHSIFTDVKLNKKVIKDYQLFMVVGVLLCIDLAIMTTWQVSDPFYRATKQMEPYPHPSSEDTLIIRENEYCQSEQMTIFIGVIYAYKGLLMIFGAFLAWETRHVSIPALNDSKHVGLSVYNVVIMCVMGAAIALVLSDHKDALFMLISVFIIFCTTATLCLVFVPKLLELRRNGQPGGTDKGRIRATLRPASKGHDCRSPGPELERRLKELRTFNSRYKRTLQAKENELQMLLGKLGTDISQLDGKDKSPKNIRLNVPPTLISKDSGSQLESSDITSLCSLTASQGIDEVYNPADRTKSTTPTSQTEPTVRFAAPESEIQKPEPTAPKKEPVTKNVSFKNHTESANNVVAVMQPAGVRPVPEKDQLAKSPYGWKVEPIEEPPYQIQKIAPREMEPKPPVKPQEVVAAPVARSHRRMSSISQSAMISDLMHVAIDQDDLDNHNLLDQKALDTESDSDYSHSLSRKDLPPDKYQAGNYPDIIDTHDSDYSTLERARLSQRRDSEKRKNNFIVAQSDLWDTNTFTYAQAKHTASHHHSPIQRSVSEKQRHSSQCGTPTRHTSSREEPRSYSGERRSSNASTHESQQSSGTHRSSRESLSSTKRGSSAATPEGYRDADTLRAHERPSRQYQQQRRGSEFPQPVSAPVAQNQRRRQSSAQVRMTSDDRTTSSSDADRSTAVVSQRHVPRGEDNVSELMSERPQQLHIASQQRSSQRHHQSTPDVANARHHKRSPGRNGDPSKHGRQYQYQKGDEKHPSKYERNRRQQHQVQSDSSAQGKQHDGTRKMYTASSESELFEYAILPIFQKLLTERHKSQPQGLNLTYGVSCPNISIKCDIVEYL